MTANQILCPDCGRPPGVGRDTCAACGAVLDPALRPALTDPTGLAARPPRAGRASLLADLPLRTPPGAAGKVVAIAAWVGVVGFLLPWATAVIGASGIGGYLNSWGLATITHLPVFLALAAVGLLAILPIGVPDWFSHGLAPLVLGGLLVGLAWPYLVGGLGSGIGLLIVVAAAIALVVGGALSLAPWRHDDGPAPVQ